MPYIHNLIVHGKFYGLDLKKEMVDLETRHGDDRFVSDEEKRLQIRRSKERKLGYTRRLRG